MANFLWDGVGNLDFSTGAGVPAGASFHPLQDRIELSDPAIGAPRIDVYEVAGDIAIVIARDVTGAVLPVSSRAYVYLPGMGQRQLAAIDAPSGPTNLDLADGGAIVIGDGTSAAAPDDGPNDVTAIVSGLGGPLHFIGLAGDDVAPGTPGDDRMLGNTGSDRLSAGPGRDSLFGGRDGDTISGEEGDDFIAGDFGPDLVLGGLGQDWMLGGPDDDHLIGGGGADSIFGGAGNDLLDRIDNAGPGVSETHGDRGDDSIVSEGGSGAWQAFGGLGSDWLQSSAHQGPATLDGGDGNDDFDVTLTGFDLIIRGGLDDDFMTARDLIGSAALFGLDFGDGNDTLFLEGDGGGRASVDMGPGSDELADLFSGVADNGLSYGATIEFSDGNDTYRGGIGSARIRTGPGDDDVIGGAGRERIEYLGSPLSDGLDRVQFFSPTFDGFRFGASYVPGGEVHAAESGDGANVGAAVNFLIATEGTYSIESFDSFLEAGSAATFKPGLYAFIDSDFGLGRIYWDADLRSTEGAVAIVELPDYTSAAQFEGFAEAIGSLIDF